MSQKLLQTLFQRSLLGVDALTVFVFSTSKNYYFLPHCRWRNSSKVLHSSLINCSRKMTSNSSSDAASNVSDDKVETGIKIGVVQMTATSDIEVNMKVCNELIQQAKGKGAKVVFLPEAFDFIAENRDQSKLLCGTIDGPVIRNYQDQASKFGVWLSLGGYHERKVIDDVVDSSASPSNGSPVPFMTNTHVMISDEGKIAGRYEKIHLFDFESLFDNVSLKESNTVIPGDKVPLPVDTPIGKIGLGICYDLRFPELSLRYRQAGAQILTFPSAFTVGTGKAHWHALLQARAIETQCYVIAAAQYGKHNEKRASYGHSLVVDPWGMILADADDYSPQLLMATIELNKLAKVRQNMPVIQHRRPEVYSYEPPVCRIPSDDIGEQQFHFGQVIIKTKMIFLEGTHARAFVNKKCVLPGHVLVTTKRVALRVKDLQPIELYSLFDLVQKVELLMEEREGSTSSTIVVQDGSNAGQTIEHVHVHVIPRQPLDFPQNDTIYKELAGHDKGENIVWREESDMESEAKHLRELVYRHHPEWLKEQ